MNFIQIPLREVVKILATSRVTDKLKEQDCPQRLSAMQQCKKNAFPAAGIRISFISAIVENWG